LLCREIGWPSYSGGGVRKRTRHIHEVVCELAYRSEKGGSSLLLGFPLPSPLLTKPGRREIFPSGKEPDNRPTDMTPATKTSAGPRAFTLPEVLLALALLALAAVAVGGAVRSSLDLLGRARVVEQPLIGWSVARDQLLLLENRQDVKQGDRINLPDGETVRWEAEVEETGLPDLFEVFLEMSSADREKTETLFLYRPEWSNSVDRGPLLDDARREIRDRLEEVRR